MIEQTIQTLGVIWWFIIPVAAVFIFRDWWLAQKTHAYISDMKWVTLEVKIPKGNIKSVLSMEQVFASFHGTYSFGIRKKDRYFKGKVEDWMSCEIVGSTEGVRFYIRAQEKYRNLVEASFLSQYPNVEIDEVDDYTNALPQDLPNEEYELFGSDFKLKKEDVYPIRTYQHFEKGTDEDKLLDPISTILEVASGLKRNEWIWIQILIKPTGDDWAEKAGDALDELSGKEKKKKKSLLGEIANVSGDFMGNLVRAPMQIPEWGEKGKTEEKPAREAQVTPGKRDAMKAVEEKTSKLAFDTILRFLYIDSRQEFTSNNVSATMGALRQFSSPTLNSFYPNMGTMTIPGPVSKFPPRRKKLLERRKKLLYRAYLKRQMPQPNLPSALKLKTAILNTEELATVFHPPLSVVSTGRLRILESRKGEPPLELPIID